MLLRCIYSHHIHKYLQGSTCKIVFLTGNMHSFTHFVHKLPVHGATITTKTTLIHIDMQAFPQLNKISLHNESLT